MKAVLVIEMPSRCFNCPLHQVVDGDEEHEFMVFCNAEHWREPITHQPVENLEERPSWCPLKPMPQKKDIDTDVYIDYRAMDKGYQCGWNACLEEITGETE